MVAQQLAPARLAAAAALRVGDQKEQVRGLGRGGDDFLDGNVLVELLADEPLDLVARHGRVRQLVARDEQVAALLALDPAVHVGVLRHDVEGQLVAFFAAAPAAAFEVAPGEPLVHEVGGRFELPHLQRRLVGGGVADGHEHELRVGHAAVGQQLHEGGQLAPCQGLRDVAHRAGDVEREGDAQRVRMVGVVARLAHLEPLRVHERVRGGLREDLAAGLGGAVGHDGRVGGVRVVSVTHGRAPS
ncbi:hypothetical protein D3C72_1583440 [compost metagenome]